MQGTNVAAPLGITPTKMALVIDTGPVKLFCCNTTPFMKMYCFATSLLQLASKEPWRWPTKRSNHFALSAKMTVIPWTLISLSTMRNCGRTKLGKTVFMTSQFNHYKVFFVDVLRSSFGLQQLNTTTIFCFSANLVITSSNKKKLSDNPEDSFCHHLGLQKKYYENCLTFRF